MVVRRVLGLAGRTLVGAGALVLLFVVYQLWGTSLHTNGAQDELRSSFDAARRRVATASTPPPTTFATTVDGTVPEPAPPGAGTPVDAIPPSANGEPVGVIRLPRIGAEHHVVEGVSVRNLKQGPGHFPGTPLPGQAGNAAIAGHRTTYGGPFNRIDELRPGDTIEVDTLQGTFAYEVIPEGGVGSNQTVGHRIITPDQVEILDQVPGRNTLTLMACHPKGDLKQRIVVVAKLITPAAPSTPLPPATDPTTELPGDTPEDGTADTAGTSPSLQLPTGDPAARLPALGWSLLAGIVWLGAWLVGRSWPSWRTWQRWAVFAAAVPIFAVPLYLAFEAVNRALPGGY